MIWIPIKQWQKNLLFSITWRINHEGLEKTKIELPEKIYDSLYDSGCNMGVHVPWKEVANRGKLPLIRPTRAP